MQDMQRWSAEIIVEERQDETRAMAMLRTAYGEVVAHGRARRSPEDPHVPRIGQELAASRALAGLSEQLRDESAEALEERLGHPVDLRR